MDRSLVAATSGALAACVSTIAVYPLDTLLVHRQTDTSKNPGSLQQQQHRRRPALLALSDTLHHLLSEEGTCDPNKSSDQVKQFQPKTTQQDRLALLLQRVSRLYSGIGVKLTEQVLRNFIYFYLYQALKTRAKRWRKPRLLTGARSEAYESPGASTSLLLAAAAALGTQLLTAPLDIVSTHAQLSRDPFRKIFLRIFKAEGIRGFYRGFGASLVLCANPAITNATFDTLKRWLQMVNLLRARRFLDPITEDEIPTEPLGPLPPLSALQSFLLGAAAKAVATCATYPYIRAKVLLQARTASRKAAAPLRGGDAEWQNSNRENTAMLSGGTGAPNHCSSSSSSKTASSGATEVEKPYQADALLRADSLQLPHNPNCKPNNPTQNLHMTRSLSVQSGLYRNHSTWRTEARQYFDYLWDMTRGASFSTSDTAQSEESVCTSGVASPRNSRFSEPRKGAGLSGGWTSPLEVTTLRRLPNAEAQASCVFSGERLLSADFSQREGEAGTLGVLVSAVMQRGFAGLYQGLSLQLIKTALASSILFLVKEQVHAQTALVFQRAKRIFGKQAVR